MINRRHALVTGATGCLGRHVVAVLVDAGYRVRASGRDEIIAAAITSERVACMLGDLTRDAELASRLVKDVDVVFHCAALSAPWGPRTAFEAANVEATRRLVDAARADRCERFVHISTPSLYFAYADRLDIREDADLPGKLVNDYARTKAEAEHIVLEAAGDRMGVTVLRPRGIFGEYDSVLAPRLLSLVRRGRFPVFAGGRAVVDVTYAGNVADAMLLCDRPDAPSGIFNITNGEPLAVHDLLGRVFRALGRDVALRPAPYSILASVASLLEVTARAFGQTREPPLLRYPLALMRYSQTLDISAARSALGYRPRISIDQGLERYARWLATGAVPWRTPVASVAGAP